MTMESVVVITLEPTDRVSNVNYKLRLVEVGGVIDQCIHLVHLKAALSNFSPLPSPCTFGQQNPAA